MTNPNTNEHGAGEVRAKKVDTIAALVGLAVAATGLIAGFCWVFAEELGLAGYVAAGTGVMVFLCALLMLLTPRPKTEGEGQSASVITQRRFVGVSKTGWGLAALVAASILWFAGTALAFSSDVEIPGLEQARDADCGCPDYFPVDPDNDDPDTCGWGEDPVTGEPTDPPATVQSPSEAITFDGGTARAPVVQAIPLEVTTSGTPPTGEVTVFATPPNEKGEGVLPRPKVHAAMEGDLLVIQACVSFDRTVSRRISGNYTGKIVIDDPRFEPAAIDYVATVQARYLWLLAPAIVWIPILAWFIVGKSAFWTNAGMASLLAAAAGAGSVYAAQGLRNPSWGGGWETAIVLLALMYGAATGVLATANAATTRLRGGQAGGSGERA